MMRTRSITFLVGFIICCSTATCQEEQQTVCSAGIQPDGFLDWTKLPANFKPGQTATIPITGVQGITASVQVVGPSLIPDGNVVVNSSLDLTLDSRQYVSVTFSPRIKGVSASIQSFGRNGQTATMTTYTGPDQFAPFGAGVSASDSDQGGDGFLYTTPLQVRSESTDIQSVVVQFSGADYEYYDLVNMRIESGSGPDISRQVPTRGLKQWLRADSVYSERGVISSWPDQSGNHADAAGGPIATVRDGPTCAAVLNFDGTSSLAANLPIDGWSGMTVILISKSTQDVAGWWENQPLFWPETDEWGATFISPSQSNVFFRFGTTQANNQPIYSRPMSAAGDYTLTTAIHDGSTDYLYLNGLLALAQYGKRSVISGVSSVEDIGAGLNKTFFSGAIGEILIYDRALDNNEREVVEHYLMKKFGLF